MPKRVDYLIAALEDAWLPSFPFDGIVWAPRYEPHIQALTGIGDAAVPALLDAIDEDERLTRLFAPSRGNCR